MKSLRCAPRPRPREVVGLHRPAPGIAVAEATGKCRKAKWLTIARFVRNMINDAGFYMGSVRFASAWWTNFSHAPSVRAV